VCVCVCVSNHLLEI